MKYEIPICIFTGLPTSNITESADFIYYDLFVDKLSFSLKICRGCYKAIIATSFSNRYKIGRMILQGNISINGHSEIHYTKSHSPDPRRIVVEELTNSIPDISPDEQLNGLLLSMAKLQVHAGAEVVLPVIANNSAFIINGILPAEGGFFLKSLEKLGLIEYEGEEAIDDENIAHRLKLTMPGLQKVHQIRGVGVESNNCFVAMSFKDDTLEIRKAIKNALTEMKFNPIIIDEEHIDKELTINDAIIAAIRKSKFCIADFTFQSSGVYFESGFALGLGKKVIYSCRKDHFKEAHFDINHFPHLVYEKEPELTKMLKDKIEAWIK